MSKKRKILTAVAVVLVLLVVTFLFTKSRWNHGDLSDPDKMIEKTLWGTTSKSKLKQKLLRPSFMAMAKKVTISIITS